MPDSSERVSSPPHRLVWASFVVVPAVVCAALLVAKLPGWVAVSVTAPVALALPVVAVGRELVARTEAVRWIGVLVATLLAFVLGQYAGLPQALASVTGIGLGGVLAVAVNRRIDGTAGTAG